MNKKIKYISIFIIISLIISTIVNLFQNKTFATSQTISTNINKIEENKYPGIKTLIKKLQKAHPNWNFQILYTDLEWSDVIENEYTGHGKSPKNLVPSNDSRYSGNWICSKCGTRVYDSGKWNCASEEAIAYMIDARNSINESDVFQFMQLSYMECTYDDISSMVKNYDYLNEKEIINTIINVGKEYNVNPYYIVARIIQEQGNGSSVLVTGKKYKGTNGITYKGYYNIFNINASGNSKAEIFTNALKYAKTNEWNSLAKSIEGGITTIANKYISYGQDTLYTQKFNVSSTKYTYYTHQYMQNILAAQNEGTTLRRTINEMGYIDGNYTFIIPVYKNMPTRVSARPKTEDNLNKEEEETKVEISTLNIADIENQIYTGNGISPEITIENNGYILVEGIDYEVKYLNNKYVGRASIEIKGIGIYTGTISKQFLIIPNKVQNLKVKSQTSYKIKITWDAIPRASGYKIYVYNTKTGKYEYYGKTKNNSATLANLIHSTKYKIKVRAYKTIENVQNFGEYSSSIKTTTLPKKVKGVKTKSKTKTSVKLSWNKVEGATGYKVYIYNTKTQKYQYYGKTYTTSINIKNLKKGTTYKMKIRAYRTIDNIQYFGGYADVYKVTTKK